MEKRTIKKHEKHPPIRRTSWGQYGRNEVGVLGAPCSILTTWIEKVAGQLGEQVMTAYVDADHKVSDAPSLYKITDKISHHQIVSTQSLNQFDLRFALSQMDLTFVNSNHFDSQKQIVFCNRKKKESLERKLDRLTDVRLVILDKGIESPYEFLHPKLPKDVTIIDIDDIASAADRISQELLVPPAIKGLILAGGKSTRMGTDKTTISYHGLPQVQHIVNLLDLAGIGSFVSCRMEQQERYAGKEVVLDQYHNSGPFGAILSAFKKDPDAAWFVVACDLPLIGVQHIDALLSQRNRSKVATCFRNPQTDWPEPLMTLWEPKSYHRLLHFMGLGYNCPRKVLINSDIQLVEMEDASFLVNVNTPTERSQVQRIIQGGGRT